PSGKDTVVSRTSIDPVGETFFQVLDWFGAYPEEAVGRQMSYIQSEGFNVSTGASAKYGEGVYAFQNESTAFAHAGFSQTKPIAAFQVGPDVTAERIVLQRTDGSQVV